MKEIVIGLQDIVEITPEGIKYINSLGERKELLFEECKQNWIAYVNSHDFRDWKGNRVHLSQGESNCVGIRNMMGKPPYLLLYGDEKVRVELCCPATNKEAKGLRNWGAAFYEAGVTTFDMT